MKETSVLTFSYLVNEVDQGKITKNTSISFMIMKSFEASEYSPLQILPALKF